MKVHAQIRVLRLILTFKMLLIEKHAAGPCLLSGCFTQGSKIIVCCLTRGSLLGPDGNALRGALEAGGPCL